MSVLRYEAHFALPLGRKKGAKLTDAEEAVLNKKRSKKTERKYKERQKDAKVEQGLTDQFMGGECRLSRQDCRVSTFLCRSCPRRHLLQTRPVWEG